MEKIEIKQIRINPDYYNEEWAEHLAQIGLEVRLMTVEELTAANDKVIYTIVVPDETGLNEEQNDDDKR